MPAPLAPSIRAAITDDIRAGKGCNQIAREHHVSPSTVSGIARANGLYFQNDWMPLTATECRRVDAALERERRADELMIQLLNHEARYTADGRETKGSRREYNRISYALYNLRRHHDRQHH